MRASARRERAGRPPRQTPPSKANNFPHTKARLSVPPTPLTPHTLSTNIRVPHLLSSAAPLFHHSQQQERPAIQTPHTPVSLSLITHSLSLPLHRAQSPRRRSAAYHPTHASGPCSARPSLSWSRRGRPAPRREGGARAAAAAPRRALARPRAAAAARGPDPLARRLRRATVSGRRRVRRPLHERRVRFVKGGAR